MKGFAGYALAGTCFIVISVWHTVRMFQRYYVCREAGARFNSSLMFSCPCLGNRVRYWPVEAYAKILLGTTGFLLEMTQGFHNGHIINVDSVQNATVILIFGITGFIDLISFRKAPIPEHTDYVSNVLAFGLYGFLVWTSPQTSPLVRLLQTLLTYAIFATVLMLLTEMRHRHNVWSSLTRAWLVLCQGTWLWQMGAIQHHPFSSKSSWDDHDHGHMAVIAMIFTWHIGFNFVLVLMIGGGVALRYRHYLSRTNYRVEVKVRDDSIADDNNHSESAPERPLFETSSV